MLKYRPMFSRITLSLALIVAVSIAPAAPIEIAKIVSPKKGCCSRVQVNRDPCHGCPMTPASPGSNSASTCCSAQSPCFVGYAHGSDNFLAGLNAIALTSFANERVTTRLQRPPVPPPRSSFS